MATQKKRMQLHFSGVNMLNECGIRFQFRYIDGIKRPPNFFLIAGTAVDKSVTGNLNSKIDSGALLPRDVVQDIARDSVVAEADKAGEVELVGDEEKAAGKDAMLNATKDKAVRLSLLHNDDCAPTLIPFQVARKFSINMDAFMRYRAKNLYAAADATADRFTKKVRESQARALNAIAQRGLDFSGEQDIVEKFKSTVSRGDMLIIRDTKTSKKSPTATQAEDSEQLTSYALASHVLDGKLPDAVALDYLVDIKTPKLVTLDSTRTLDDIERFMLRFSNAVHALHTGIFTPTKTDDWRCSEKWCGYWHMCPYARRPVSSAPTAQQPLVQITGTSDVSSQDTEDFVA